MKQIKFLSGKRLKVDGITYRPYLVSDLPKDFGVKYIDDGEKVKDGISSWFNFKGFTYIIA